MQPAAPDVARKTAKPLTASAPQKKADRMPIADAGFSKVPLMTLSVTKRVRASLGSGSNTISSSCIAPPIRLSSRPAITRPGFGPMSSSRFCRGSRHYAGSISYRSELPRERLATDHRHFHHMATTIIPASRPSSSSMAKPCTSDQRAAACAASCNGAKGFSGPRASSDLAALSAPGLRRVLTPYPKAMRHPPHAMPAGQRRSLRATLGGRHLAARCGTSGRTAPDGIGQR